ncbi:MAG: hypothetical protein ACOX8X_06335 [Methanomethylophilus sp.]
MNTATAVLLVIVILVVILALYGTWRQLHVNKENYGDPEALKKHPHASVRRDDPYNIKQEQMKEEEKKERAHFFSVTSPSIWISWVF